MILIYNNILFCRFVQWWKCDFSTPIYLLNANRRNYIIARDPLASK